MELNMQRFYQGKYLCKRKWGGSWRRLRELSNGNARLTPLATQCRRDRRQVGGSILNYCAPEGGIGKATGESGSYSELSEESCVFQKWGCFGTPLCQSLAGSFLWEVVHSGQGFQAAAAGPSGIMLSVVGGLPGAFSWPHSPPLCYLGHFSARTSGVILPRFL